jgi:hypothetical protein
MKVDKKEFDAVLGKLIEAKPDKRSEVRPTPKPRKAQKSSARGARKA